MRKWFVMLAAMSAALTVGLVSPAPGGPVLARPTRCPSYPSKLTTFTTRACTSPGLQAW